MKDILIMIAALGIFLVNAYVKAKKKQAQAQQRQQQRQRQQQYQQTVTQDPAPEPQSARPLWQEVVETVLQEEGSERENSSTSYEEIPKNSSYFTYETYEPEITEETHREETFSEEPVEKSVQNIDNEIEKTGLISIEMEELYKGIVYSEILKRPYN